MRTSYGATSAVVENLFEIPAVGVSRYDVIAPQRGFNFDVRSSPAETFRYKCIFVPKVYGV